MATLIRIAALTRQTMPPHKIASVTGLTYRATNSKGPAVRVSAAMPPIIAVIGPKITAASANSIAEPMRMAAIPPKAVNVCLSLCMTGSLPVLVKIWLPGPRRRLSGKLSEAFASQELVPSPGH